MSKEGQQLTIEAYENKSIVEGYVKEHSLQPKLSRQTLADFAQTLPGKNILDLGCGPGHDSYTFAELGYHVIGIDYSHEMIKAAKALKSSAQPPKFIQADMRNLSSVFQPNQFDGVWACASLLHVERDEIDSVLSQLFSILHKGGKVYIGLKGGNGEEVVEESKYGPTMKREFTFWQSTDFDQLLLNAGFTMDNFNQETKNNRQGAATTSWLNYWVSVKK